MCLYPKIIKNKKYLPNKKNGGNPPKTEDGRVKYVPVGCGKCIECSKQRGRNWQIRLLEEIRHDQKAEFVTLTFSNEHITELIQEIAIKNEGEVPNGYELDNEIATMATRRFLERWRKETGKSIKHWLVTELGHNGTENIHIHGLIWTKDKKEIKAKWKYGHVFVGDFVNEKTVNYISKYLNKQDLEHQEYKPKILTSSGIGRGYTTRADSKLNKFNKKGETNEAYRSRQGFKMSLPIYYRNKIYTEEEREKLWIQKLDKQERWVLGTKIDVSQSDKQYWETLKYAQEKNKRLGYGDGTKDWERSKYENDKRKLMYEKRTGRKTLHEGRKNTNQ